MLLRKKIILGIIKYEYYLIIFYLNKTYDINMSYYIVLNGPLGSGKSTNAKKLAQVLDAKRIIMDDV